MKVTTGRFCFARIPECSTDWVQVDNWFATAFVESIAEDFVEQYPDAWELGDETTVEVCESIGGPVWTVVVHRTFRAQYDGTLVQGGAR